MEPTTALKRTPFHAFHRSAGAKLVEFSGFEMPLRYTGDVHEHRLVRTRAGLFDVSHMGEFTVLGTAAAAFLERVLTNDVGSLGPGQARYSLMCRPDGGIVDDLYVYRSADRFMLVVNAANVRKDFDWLRAECPAGAEIQDRSEATALLAVQGPAAPEVLRGHVPDAVLALSSNRFLEGALFGVPVLIARTGYTGEDGFELYFAPDGAERMWEGLLRAGRTAGLEPVGLGARDTLRLEMGYMLYGSDIDETTTPLEAGLGWTVKLARPGFIGREALVRQREEGVRRRLVGLEAEGRRVPRQGMAVEHGGRTVGRVTSGAFSPSLERPVALAYVEGECAAGGAALGVAAGRARIVTRVVPRPFYTRGSRR